MTKAPKNVLLLSIDSIRTDRLGLYGYTKPTTPVLDAFAKDALVMDNAYTLGPFTQLACIQLFTSSRPYDYGGYDKGAFNRPDTLFKRFKDAGYATWGLSTIHWVSPFYGYTDGLDEGVFVFHLNTLIGMAVMNMRDTLRLYFDGSIPKERMLEHATPVIRQLFYNVESYCDMLDLRMSDFQRDFPHSKIVNDAYVPDKVRRVVKRHRSGFEANNFSYIKKHLSRTPDAHEWLAKDWRYARTLKKLFHEAGLRATNAVLRKFNPVLANSRETRYRMAVDAHAIAEKTSKAIQQAPDDRPSFIWAHFKDCHQPYVSGSGLNWVNETKDYLSELGHSPEIDPTIVFHGRPKSPERISEISALYDASIRSTDQAIGNILKTLEGSPRGQDTVVVICGDHGEEIFDHGDYGHLTMHYEHNAKIPMLVKAPGLAAGRSNALVTSMDLSPTITSLAGIEPAENWVGVPMQCKEASKRRSIVLESFCRGNCIFDHRPLYMAVRDHKYKFIWREYVDLVHKYGSAEPMLFDIEVDPLEQNNIYQPDHPQVSTFKQLLAARLAEVPEISDQRLINCFGDDARTVLKNRDALNE
jgi:arylsulfatase A-like enzyme